MGQSPRRRPDLLVHKRLDRLGDKGGEVLVNRELADGQFKGLNVRKTAHLPREPSRGSKFFSVDAAPFSNFIRIVIRSRRSTLSPARTR